MLLKYKLILETALVYCSW